jgi:hypothetical protein
MSARLTIAILLGALLGAGACSDDEPDAPPPILTITNSWGVEGESGHSFAFVSGDDGETAGAFTGDEFTLDDDYPLAGTWENGRVEFTVERSTGDVTFTARFSEDNPERLTVRAGDEELVLLLGG